MAFILKWRDRTTKNISPIITGLTQYPTVEAVERQVAIWKFLWPYNEYYIEPTSANLNEQDWWPNDDNNCHICGQPSH